MDEDFQKEQFGSFAKKMVSAGECPISDCLLTATVRHAVSQVQVGPYYGRRTIQGLLSARYGIRVNQTRIGQTLCSVDLEAYRRRTHTARRQSSSIHSQLLWRKTAFRSK